MIRRQLVIGTKLSGGESMAEQREFSATVLMELHRVVDVVLRYVGAGGSALLAFGVIQGENFGFLRAGANEKDVSGWLILLFVSVLGLAIYSLHRAIFFRAIHTLGRKPFFKGSPWNMDNEIRDSQTLNKGATPPHLWSGVFDRWAAECHFLYCSAWGCLLALCLAEALGRPWGRASTIVLVVGLAMLIAAIVHDVFLSKKAIEKYGLEVST